MASQSSPLTMALLGGGAGANSPYGMAMYDPQTMAAMQRLGFAQNLASEGMSSAPAYPMQALSRLGQALLGGVMLKQGFGDLEQLGQQRQAESAKFNDAVYGAQQPQAPTPAAAPPPPQSAAPAGTQFAANNPLNIRYAGQDGATNTNGFAAFPTPEAGQTATTNQFGLYADRGVNTLRGLISTWAPPNENDTKGYIARVSKETGIDPDAQINLRDPAVATVIQHSMAGVEGNKNAQAPGVQYAQAGNVATDASTAPAPQQPQGAPQQPASPQVGLDNPNVQHALQIQRMAGMALAAHPNPMDPMHVQAQQAMEYSKSLLNIGQYQNLPGANQVNTVTGETKYGPTWRVVPDAHGNLIAVGPNGENRMISNNSSGIAGNTPEADAMRTMIELRGKVAGGTATPDDIGRYNTALTLFQHYGVQTDPSGKQLGVMPGVPVPQGMPGPAGQAQQPSAAPMPQLDPGAVGGKQSIPGTPQVPAKQPAPQQTSGFQPMTPSARGPEAAQKIVEEQGTQDAKAISEEQAATLKGHSVLGTTSTIRSMLPQVTTGVAADQRLAAARIMSAAGLSPDSVKELTGTDAPAGEVLQKKLFELTTGAVRGMGAREPGSVMMMFQKNYPQLGSRNLTIDSMTRLIDMDQLYKEDEIAGRQQYQGQQVQGLAQNKPYGGLSGYQQPDPRLYQAAALASGGMPYSVWSQGLPADQQTAALKLAARAYPDASALDAKGVRHVFKGGGGG